MKKLYLLLLSAVLLIGCSTSPKQEDQQVTITTPEVTVPPELANATPVSTVETEPEIQIGAIGDTITSSNGMQYTLDGVVKEEEYDAGGGLIKTSENGKYVFVFITIYNAGNEEYVTTADFSKGEKTYSGRDYIVIFMPYNGIDYDWNGKAHLEPEETAHIYFQADLTEETSADLELMINLSDGTKDKATTSFYINK